MTTLLITHPCFVEHDTGPGHPERPDRMRAIDKALAHELFATLKREEAPLRDDVEDAIELAHPRAYVDISDTIDAKMDAIGAHQSQFANRGLPIDIYRDIARMNGRIVGVQYAEGLDVGRLLLA